MTAILECFEWTLNKPYNRTGGMASNHTINAWGSTFGATSFYYDSIFKGRAHSHLIIIGIERGVLLVMAIFKTNE